MTLATALYTLLSGTAAITDLVGAHVWHLRAEQDLGDDTTVYYPCVVFSVTSTEPILAFNSTSGYTDMVRIASMSIISPDEAQSIADAIKAALHLYAGVMGGAGGVTVLCARLEREEEEPDIESGVFTVAQTYRIDRAA